MASASTQTQGRPFEWAGRFETGHTPPRKAALLDGRGPRGQRRVAIMGDYQTERARTNRQYEETTTWLYNEDGTIDGDASGDWKLVAL